MRERQILLGLCDRTNFSRFQNEHYKWVFINVFVSSLFMNAHRSKHLDADQFLGKFIHAEVREEGTNIPEEPRLKLESPRPISMHSLTCKNMELLINMNGQEVNECEHHSPSSHTVSNTYKCFCESSYPNICLNGYLKVVVHPQCVYRSHDD